jgi:pimeloyl-ACP methyl ester carboxylesterase
MQPIDRLKRVKRYAIAHLAPLLLTLSPFAFAATNEGALAIVETGEFDGAAYRIDLPRNWNHSLVVYYHGFQQQLVRYDVAPAVGFIRELVNRGYAVVQSGYSKAGWAIEQAVPETERVRRYFIAKHGQAKETYASGASMGGMLAVLSIEQFPNRYDGALPLCGLLQPASWALTRMFAMRAAFEYYFPGALPGPLHAPADAKLDDSVVARIKVLLAANPQGRAELTALMQLKTDDDLAGTMVFFAFIVRDLEQKLGASPFDNRYWIYAGGTDDNALNAGVRRYSADPAAAGYLTQYYTPTGRLQRPTLAVHDTYDPLIPAPTVSLYADQVLRQGFARNFVQQYVPHDGHCEISAEEATLAFDGLVEWRRTGSKPANGQVAVVPSSTPR